MARPPESRLVYSTGGPVPAAQPGKEEAPPSGRRSILIRLERRSSGRLVTVVTGLPGTAAEVGAMARQLRTACRAGGTLRDEAVELQGDQRDKVEAFLSGRGLRGKRASG